MKIEKITKLKSGLYQISIIDEKSEEKKFKLSEDVLIKHNLYSNKIVSVKDLEMLNDLANYSKIYTSTLNYISFKMRTEREVYEYMTEKGCGDKVKQEIIDKLKNLNYINDQIYSDSYVKYQFDSNKKGKKVLQDELLKKGIELKLIEKSLNQISHEMILRNINLLINYYVKVNKSKTVRKLKETILRTLLVKGYEYEDILHCLNHYELEEVKDDTSLIEKEFNKAMSKYQKKYEGHELKTKVIRALMNKGFEYDLILNQFNNRNE